MSFHTIDLNDLEWFLELYLVSSDEQNVAITALVDVTIEGDDETSVAAVAVRLFSDNDGLEVFCGVDLDKETAQKLVEAFVEVHQTDNQELGAFAARLIRFCNTNGHGEQLDWGSFILTAILDNDPSTEDLKFVLEAGDAAGFSEIVGNAETALQAHDA
ncbi:MAG: hypothetical protein HQ530_03560 [Parcubacteria group bacterium]|nr:hypothetical protein [Parcubacteria group bacterium]